MLATGRGERRPTTSTDCHAAAGAGIVPRGDTAVTMPTATACSRTNSSSSTAAGSRTSSSSTATTTTTASATTASAMRERGRYR